MASATPALTYDQLIANGWEKEDVDTVRMLMSEMHDIKMSQDDLKSREEVVKMGLESILAGKDIRIKDDDHGSCGYRVTSRETLDKDQLKVSLIEMGVDSEKVSTAFDSATSKKESAYVEYRKPSAGKS